MIVTADILDVCLPDYFQGHGCSENEVLVCATLHDPMSGRTLAHALLDDFNSLADFPEGAEDVPDDDILRALMKAIRDYGGIDAVKKYWQKPRENEDISVYCYAILTFEEES